MLQPRADQVAVDLVRDAPDARLLDDRGHALKLFFRPDAAGGVVRVAEEHQRRLGIGALALKVVKVDLPRAVPVDQVGADAGAGVVIGRVLEVRIRGRDEQDLLVRRADVFHHLEQRRDDAVGHHQLLLRELPAVLFAAPAAERVVIVMTEHARVAEDARVKALPDAVDDHAGRGELHIGDPHAHKFLVLVGERHRALFVVEDVAAETVRVHRVRAAALDDLVKVVHAVFLRSIRAACALMLTRVYAAAAAPSKTPVFPAEKFFCNNFPVS